MRRKLVKITGERTVAGPRGEAGMIRIAAVMALLASPAVAEPLPHPKNGQCSGGYMQSGSFCVPKSERSVPAVPKPAGVSCPPLASERLGVRADALTPPSTASPTQYSLAAGNHPPLARMVSVRSSRQQAGRTPMGIDGSYGSVYRGGNGLGIGVFTVKGDRLEGGNYFGGRIAALRFKTSRGTSTSTLPSKCHPA